MNELFENGKVITVDGIDLECISFSHEETEEGSNTFGCTFRPKTELDAERKAEEDRIAAEEPTVPEVNKEETLNVK